MAKVGQDSPSPSSNGLTLEWMDPYELAENPRNPRRHPQAQRRALYASRQRLGWLQPLLYNQRTQRLIDGHLRREDAIETGEGMVPVLVVDIDEEAELAALAAIDRITGMAEVNEAEYASLLRSLFDFDDDLLDALSLKDESFDDVSEDPSPDRSDVNAVHLVPGEQYNYVMLLFRNDLDWLSAIDHFGIDEPAKDLFHNSKVVGRTRVVDGSEYLRKILKDA